MITANSGFAMTQSYEGQHYVAIYYDPGSGSVRILRKAIVSAESKLLEVVIITDDDMKDGAVSLQRGWSRLG
ncbi:hypothetical protein J6590_024730 [Homalodisca vitripennis]|nr:hypothetical protein J6590_024730 [Homalodisca vitripennis]